MIAAANPSTPSSIAARNTRIVKLALKKLGLPFCLHDYSLLSFSRPRYLAVRCTKCGRESEGFAVGENDPREPRS